LVTGSTRGIGLAIARTLQREGCQVVLNGRDAAATATASAAIPGSLGIAADVQDAADARRLIAETVVRAGRLDVLVCNVGSGRSVPPGEETPEEWQRVFALNFWATTNMVEAAGDAFGTGGGSIVCISSICGLELVPGAPVTYSCAKAALNAYVRGMARPLAKRGLRINAVAAGNISFPGSVWERRRATEPEAVDTLLQRDVAQGRLGSAEDVAELVAYLASARAGFATGAVWTLDGGQTRG
jgi:NAD(P)-dependent dehydrogenase (short-subunit alcohol dehydrogenase family)